MGEKREKTREMKDQRGQSPLTNLGGRLEDPEMNSGEENKNQKKTEYHCGLE